MEFFEFQQDFEVLCLTADSFPEGIGAAHRRIRSLMPPMRGRRYFGISRPNQKGVIVYQAAAEKMETDGPIQATDVFLIAKGQYVGLTLRNSASDSQSIKAAFESILARRDIDSSGYCLEEYRNDKDVRCMVRLKSAK